MILIAIASSMVFMACEKDDDNGAPGETNPIQPGSTSKTFSQDFQNKKEAFVGIITRNTCGICGQSGHPTFDGYLKSNQDVTGVSFNYSERDPLYHAESYEFASFMNLRGTPSFTEEFANFTNNPSRWQSEISDFESTNANAFVAMNGTVVSNGFDIEVKVAVTDDATQHVPHLAVYMLENNIISPQSDYGASPATVQDYIHNHVYRGSATGLFGESIANSWVTGDTIAKTYNFTPSASVDTTNVYFVAVLMELDASGNPVSVINSQQLLR